MNIRNDPESESTCSLPSLQKTESAPGPISFQYLANRAHDFIGAKGAYMVEDAIIIEALRPRTDHRSSMPQCGSTEMFYGTFCVSRRESGAA
ncbi:hypothetical protein [Arthrobacter sp. N1]|uniref:hypothetical protein n=1 Tax=Arthrobacter sp. N1 TaxID=619291 RepID=UPI003BB0F71B